MADMSNYDAPRGPDPLYTHCNDSKCKTFLIRESTKKTQNHPYTIEGITNGKVKQRFPVLKNSQDNEYYTQVPLSGKDKIELLTDFTNKLEGRYYKKCYPNNCPEVPLPESSVSYSSVRGKKRRTMKKKKKSVKKNKKPTMKRDLRKKRKSNKKK